MTNYITGIKAIVAAMTIPPAFYHESTQMMNIKADAETGAVCYMDQLGIGGLKRSGGGWLETEVVIIKFLKKTPFENDINLNETLINDGKVLAVEFLQRLCNSTLFQHPTEVETGYVYEQFDANFAGFGIKCNLTLRQPISSCTP